MNPVDWVIIGILAVSVLFGLYRGFIASVASMGGSLISLGLSFWLSPMVSEFLRNNTSLSNTLMSYADAATRLKDSALSALMNVICFVITFVLLLILFHVIINFLKAVFRFPVLKQLNSLFGGLFGLLRGALLCFVLFALVPLFETVIPVENFGEMLRTSTLAPMFNSGNLILSIMNGHL